MERGKRKAVQQRARAEEEKKYSEFLDVNV